MAPITRLYPMIVALLALSLCSGAVAEESRQQQPNASPVVHLTFSKSAVPINGPWKFRTGDSPLDPFGAPVWAQPGFNDSGWETVDLTPKPGISDPSTGDPRYVPGWPTLGHPGYAGYAWYRLQISTDETLN